jgi:hypothetical protein
VKRLQTALSNNSGWFVAAIRTQEVGMESMF